MKHLFLSTFMLSLLLGFSACDQTARQEDAEVEEDTLATAQDEDGGQQNITVSPAPDFPEYPDSKLTLQEPKEGTNLQPGKVTFNFNVENYELGAQTENAENLMLANSDKGQHIHYIEDNDPYSAHYEPTFEKELSEGNHVILAFLSRSYHASVKNKDAFVVKQYSVGNVDESQKADLSKPHMFYSRPKGTYSGPEQTQKILLDFFLVNTDLSANGNKIRATINGQEFMLDEWKPYIVEGLPMGENTFKLEFLDSEGNLIDSPFNPVSRTVTLEEGNQNQ
ncbi:MAG: phosphopeptide-binding protein [Candidatus Cyclobacteriaceae bacterium M2_1C_046]